MNKRITKKRLKHKLNTPTKYLATGGFLTPYACPTCGSLYSYHLAWENKICLDCGQSLIWWDVFETKG